MGKDDLEPAGAAPFWPLAEQRQGRALGPFTGAQAEPAGAAAGDLNLATLWNTFWERRWLILACVAIGLTSAVLITFLTTPVYRSIAVIEINPPNVDIIGEGKSGGFVAQDREFLATQYGLLASRSLAERVAQELNLASNEEIVPESLDREARQKYAASLLHSNLDVEPVRDSRLIRISYSSVDPVLAARAVNGFADAFISTSLERRYEASSYARNFLQRQVEKVRRDLEQSERELVAYAQQQGIITTGADSDGRTTDANSLTGESLVALNRALAEAQTRRIAAEQTYRQSLGGASAAEISERTADLRSQKAALEAEYQQKLSLFQPDYPEMVQLRSRINSLERAIQEEARNVRSGRSSTLQAAYQAALAEERNLAARVNQLRSQVLNLRGRSIQYNILQREVDTNRALYDALLQRYKEVGVAGGIGTSNASVVDRGQIPTAPYKPSLIFNLLIGLLGGFAVGAGLALFLETVIDTIKTPDDVRNKLKLPFLGGVPGATGKPIEELSDPLSPISEAYLSITTLLGFATEAGAPKTLLVTSTRPAEGKSTSAYALAQSLARLGKTVLLIDADMRKPAFVTSSEEDIGLSAILAAGADLESQILSTNADGLYLMPSGPIPPNPAELLAGQRLRSLLAQASSQFDLIVVDGPPVLGLADAPLLSSVCSGTMLVVEANKTRTRAAIESLNRLKAAGAQLVGATLTRYKHRTSTYGYSYQAYRYGQVSDRGREIRLALSREQ